MTNITDTAPFRLFPQTNQCGSQTQYSFVSDIFEKQSKLRLALQPAKLYNSRQRWSIYFLGLIYLKMSDCNCLGWIIALVSVGVVLFAILLAFVVIINGAKDDTDYGASGYGEQAGGLMAHSPLPPGF